MIVAELYHTVYLLLVTFFSLVWFSKYNNRVGSSFVRPSTSNYTAGVSIAVVLALFIGTRPISPVFPDMPQYVGILERYGGIPFTFDYNADNLIWDNMLLYFASIRLSPIIYYVMIASFYYLGSFFACKRLFPRDYVAAFLVWAVAFSTFSYGTNGLKAGTAATFFLLALSYRKNLKVCLPLAFLSWGIHHSMFVPLLALFVTIIYRKPKYYFYFWLFSIVIAAAHITVFQNLFAGFSDEKGAGYLTAESGDDYAYLTGLRLDFILYSAMPVLMGWYAVNKMKVQSLIYNTLLCMYLLCNGVWALCMYASFTNRIAYLSWFMYPIVLIYPILNEQWFGNRYRTFSKIAWLHLGFTLAMHFIYYA